MCILALRKCQKLFCHPQLSWGGLSSAGWKPVMGRDVLQVPRCRPVLPQPHSQQQPGWCRAMFWHGYSMSKLRASPKQLSPWPRHDHACRCTKPMCALYVQQNNTIWKRFSWVSQCRYRAKGKGGGGIPVPTERQVSSAPFCLHSSPPTMWFPNPFLKKPTFHFPMKIFFFFTQACKKVLPHSPFPPVTRLKVQCGAASIGLLFFTLQEILIANKSPSSKAHDGWTACNNFTLLLFFPQGLALHKVTYSYWSLWALNKQNSVDLTSWGVYFQ